MTINSNQELYDSVRKTISALREAGEEHLANELYDTFRISTVPGEILGSMRSVLFSIRENEIYSRLDIRQNVNDGIDYLDRILGKWK